MRPTHRTTQLIGAGLLALLVPSCTAETAGVDHAEVASVTVSPSAAELRVGGSVALQATVKDGQDNVLGGRRVVWNSSDPTIAAVSDVGVVTARHPGSAQVAASAEGKFAIAVVTVVAPVASVTVVPSKVDLLVGQAVRLQAVARDAAGATLAGRPTTWVTSKPSVATVDGTGLVTAVAKGSATITATSEGKSASASVTVSRP